MLNKDLFISNRACVPVCVYLRMCELGWLGCCVLSMQALEQGCACLSVNVLGDRVRVSGWTLAVYVTTRTKSHAMRKPTSVGLGCMCAWLYEQGCDFMCTCVHELCPQGPCVDIWEEG